MMNLQESSSTQLSKLKCDSPAKASVRFCYTRPWTLAKGSQFLSLCQSYSLQVATFRAVSKPCKREITPRAISMPADTPDDVTNLSSSTQRASRTQLTFGPCSQTQLNAALLVVAALPSSSPALARSALPVQTLRTCLDLLDVDANQSMRDLLLTSRLVPAPPGTRSMSKNTSWLNSISGKALTC